MKGQILDFSIPEGQGVIAGDDGNRYTFPGKEWKSSARPRAGLRVDYEADGRNALAVYLEPSLVVGDETQSEALEASYEGYYKSSDDKVVGGVCAGLAHKWKMSVPALRVATFLLMLFWVPLLGYVVCWIAFPARPTKVHSTRSSLNRQTPQSKDRNSEPEGAAGAGTGKAAATGKALGRLVGRVVK